MSELVETILGILAISYFIVFFFVLLTNRHDKMRWWFVEIFVAFLWIIAFILYPTTL